MGTLFLNTHVFETHLDTHVFENIFAFEAHLIFWAYKKSRYYKIINLFLIH